MAVLPFPRQPFLPGAKEGMCLTTCAAGALKGRSTSSASSRASAGKRSPIFLGVWVLDAGLTSFGIEGGRCLAHACNLALNVRFHVYVNYAPSLVYCLSRAADGEGDEVVFFHEVCYLGALLNAEPQVLAELVPPCQCCRRPTEVKIEGSVLALPDKSNSVRRDYLSG